MRASRLAGSVFKTRQATWEACSQSSNWMQRMTDVKPGGVVVGVVARYFGEAVAGIARAAEGHVALAQEHGDVGFVLEAIIAVEVFQDGLGIAVAVGGNRGIRRSSGRMVRFSGERRVASRR